MYIGGNDADAIAINLQHVVPPRPLTHDFLCAVIDLLGSSIKNVVINEIKNDTFYASARLACYGTFLDVDCRPSDALNVAVRLGAPILVTEEVLNIASIDLPDLQDIPDTSWLPR